ncbi:hypothetical protein DID73_02550 [Candidatus Marinamargulisbacteria bacterium SCGC AG-343-K17]|nr:hypothetical protein DID73_02550 [Candidatus Marinamargulisbacteria bacterium SCGC AG-343-K17]
MISLNGLITEKKSFDWLADSGFRYGYGCFETMLFTKEHIPLINHHTHRLTQSLDALCIDYTPNGLHDRIIKLAKHLQLNTPHVCHVFITGGNVLPQPSLKRTSTEIISFSPMPSPDFSKKCEFKTVQPSDYYRFKSLSYAHHIQALAASHHWPIYIDTNDQVIDSSIFSIGIIQNNTITFAQHAVQLPSVSKKVIIEKLTTISKPLQKNDLLNADTLFGCNAIRGAFPISLESNSPTTHQQIDAMNDVLDFNGRDLT